VKNDFPDLKLWYHHFSTPPLSFIDHTNSTSNIAASANASAASFRISLSAVGDCDIAIATTI